MVKTKSEDRSEVRTALRGGRLARARALRPALGCRWTALQPPASPPAGVRSSGSAISKYYMFVQTDRQFRMGQYANDTHATIKYTVRLYRRGGCCEASIQNRFNCFLKRSCFHGFSPPKASRVMPNASPKAKSVRYCSRHFGLSLRASRPGAVSSASLNLV